MSIILLSMNRKLYYNDKSIIERKNKNNLLQYLVFEGRYTAICCVRLTSA